MVDVLPVLLELVLPEKAYFLLSQAFGSAETPAASIGIFTTADNGYARIPVAWAKTLLACLLCPCVDQDG